MPLHGKRIERVFDMPEGKLRIRLITRSYSSGRGAAIKVFLNEILIGEAKENWKSGKIVFNGNPKFESLIRNFFIDNDYYGRERLTIRVDKLRK